MPSIEHFGKNLLGNYFNESTAIYEIIGGMQQGKTLFDPSLVARANIEVRAKSKELDNSTYKFAQDFSRMLYGHQNRRRVIMFVEGTFYGSSNIETVIAIDLGNNPHDLFRTDHRYPTVDAAVTYEQTIRFFEENGNYLSREGYDAFELGKSRFFYFKESDLAEKGHLDEDGNVKMTGLVPLVVPTKGYVMTEEVEDPSLNKYMQFAPLHASYRFKNSMMDKLLDRTVSRKNTEGEVRLIADWVAHRSIVRTKEDVDSLEQRLQTPGNIGNNSSIEWNYTNDYYSESPKKSSSIQFKAKNVVVTVTTKGFPDKSLREIQVVDKEQYFINELSKNVDKTREDYEMGRNDIPQKKIMFYYELRDVLEKIFNVENVVIPIRS